jgi:hypothetical protein
MLQLVSLLYLDTEKHGTWTLISDPSVALLALMGPSDPCPH